MTWWTHTIWDSAWLSFLRPSPCSQVRTFLESARLLSQADRQTQVDGGLTPPAPESRPCPSPRGAKVSAQGAAAVALLAISTAHLQPDPL